MEKKSSANQNSTWYGKQIEAAASLLIEGKDYVRLENKFRERDVEHPKYYFRQTVVGIGVYGKKRTVDFLLYDKENFPGGLIIECKSQREGGSAEDKLCKTVDDMIYGSIPSIFVLHGSGFSDGMYHHLDRKRGGFFRGYVRYEDFVSLKDFSSFV